MPLDAIFTEIAPVRRVPGQPWVIVSPVGTGGRIKQANNGAQFGPDTPGTTTSGIQEAIESGATWIILMAGTFNVSNTIYLPSAYGIRIEGSLTSRNPQQQSGDYPQTWINYTGAGGYAIDTASSPPPANGYYAKGYINGLAVICTQAGASGVNLNNINADIGTLVIGGASNGSGNTIGFSYQPISQAAEINIANLSVYAFDTLVVTTAEHLSISHLSTAYTTAPNPIYTHTGYGLTVGYWHHFLNGTAQPSYLLSLTNATARNVFIGNLLCEGSTYTSFSSSYFTNPGGATGTPIVVGMFGGASMTGGDTPTAAQLGTATRILWGNSGPVQAALSPGGGVAPVAVTVAASGTPFAVSTTANSVVFVTDGGATTAWAVNGVTVAASMTAGNSIYLKAGDTLTIGYTVAPSIVAMGA